MQNQERKRDDEDRRGVGENSGPPGRYPGNGGMGKSEKSGELEQADGEGGRQVGTTRRPQSSGQADEEERHDPRQDSPPLGKPKRRCA